MRRLVAILLVAGVCVLLEPLEAQTNRVAFETVTFADTAIAFTVTTIHPSGGPIMTACTGKLETASIRIRYDGTAPSSTVGMLIDVGDIVTIRGTPYLDDFQGIRTGGTSGVIAFSCTRD